MTDKIENSKQPKEKPPQATNRGGVVYLSLS